MLNRGGSERENRLYSSEYDASRELAGEDLIGERKSSLESSFLSQISRTSTFELIKETP